MPAALEGIQVTALGAAASTLTAVNDVGEVRVGGAVTATRHNTAASGATDPDIVSVSVDCRRFGGPAVGIVTNGGGVQRTAASGWSICTARLRISTR